MHPLVEQLRDHLAEEKISANQVAMHSGVSQPVISSWLRGARTPGLDTFVRVARAAGLSLNLGAQESDERLAQLVLAMNRLAIAKTAEERNARRDELVRAGREAKDYLSSIGIEAEARL
jgi:transcriptional regulator with XRE-family HTH domain